VGRNSICPNQPWLTHSISQVSIWVRSALRFSQQWEVAVEQPLVCPPLKGGKDGWLPKPCTATGFACYSTIDLRGKSGGPSRELRALWTANSSAAMKKVFETKVCVKAGGGRCFLDGDRLALVDDVGTLVGALDRGELDGNAFGRLVIGPKGTGKSSFLQALVLATQYLSRQILAVWCDVGSTHKSMRAQSPAGVIARALQLAIPTIKLPVAVASSDDVVATLNFLDTLGLRLFLVNGRVPSCVQSAQSRGGAVDDASVPDGSARS
jgi:hypothetical protein